MLYYLRTLKVKMELRDLQAQPQLNRGKLDQSLSLDMLNTSESMFNLSI